MSKRLGAAELRNMKFTKNGGNTTRLYTSTTMYRQTDSNGA